MTKRNKLIVGAVVVLGALYLYDRNKKMKAVAEAKSGAEKIAETPLPFQTGGFKPSTNMKPDLIKNLRADSIMVTAENKFL